MKIVVELDVDFATEEGKAIIDDIELEKYRDEEDDSFYAFPIVTTLLK